MCYNNPTSPEKKCLPFETFTVLQNRYYRFRTINAGFDVAFEISIDDVSYFKKQTPNGFNLTAIISQLSMK